MTILLLLIPLAFIFAAIAIRLLFWAVRSGQYDDLDTESKRILFDDDPAPLTKSGEDSAAKDKGIQ